MKMKRRRSPRLAETEERKGGGAAKKIKSDSRGVVSWDSFL
jgi:hypothetical protein